MANYLLLNQNQVFNGLGTLTFNVPATVMVPGSGQFITTSNVPFTVRCQVTVPQADAQGAGAGSGSDQGLGMLGGTQGIGQGSNLSLGNGGTGLGFGAGTSQTTYNTSGSGHGAGTGGGGEGFTGGDLGTGHGGVGQGFGAGNGYQQPPAYTNTPSVSAAAVLSQLSVVVNLNGSPVYTAPAFEGTQGQLEFAFTQQCSNTDVITVVFSSSLGADKALNAIKSNTSVSQGY
jgi:hypothetical protein